MEKQKKNQRSTLITKKEARRRARVRRQITVLGVSAVILVAVIVILIRVFTNRQPQPAAAIPINEACESYRESVTQIATQYDMSDYVDLILALMMQESSGAGPDVMQSSEGAFNTEYPREPDGITDVQYSISCGIQELKYAMDKAGVTGPSDLEHIRLALQAYNFGADKYLSYMEEQGEDSWTVESAEAFAQMASGGRERETNDSLSERAGPWAYGDQHYPEHVLQYYDPKK